MVMIPSMRSLLGRSFIWVLALALVASGVAGRHCAAAQQMPTTTAAHRDLGVAHHHADAARHDQHHNTHGAIHPAATDDPVQPTPDQPPGGQCCSACAIAVAMLPGANGAIFTVFPVSFPLDSDDCVARTITVDPGIPKRIA